MTQVPQSFSVDRIFLDLKNPRHKPYTTEAEVIDYLCGHEQVYALAKDIASIGLNPTESFAIVPIGTKRTPGQNYVVAEGNRRLCAIKLLNDPDLAPANARKDFRRLAEGTTRTFAQVPAVVLEDANELSIWLDRIHGGVQGGVGRKPWNSEQKTRHIGGRKNVLAQKVLDYAESRGFISPAERTGKLTTAQRYLGNAMLREAVGIESTSADDISRTRPAEDFDILIKTFVRDLVDNKANSRANREEIKEYSRRLSSMDGVSARRVPSTSLNGPLSKRPRRGSAKEPSKPKSIAFEEIIERGLKRIGSYKLQKLYFSICDLPLDKHTPLISIGTWSFLETLTARYGRTAGTPFPSFFSKDRLASLGIADRDQRSAISDALQRISALGNTTKHHETSANFNGEQLANDMDTLTELIVKLLAQTTP